ncbi:MAG: 4-hydroxy-3-methylbut-2-enyl diphosphate reductase [Cytophagales bacterium]|nr:MAG: 4-hydroxy-3-methylbut-2-enyl diphosphate reductase [Cytophagales bacterium]
MQAEIDKNSGYCFGVEYAIQMAEEALKESEALYCLGDIVHNDMEVKRLYEKGLRIITHEDLRTLQNCRVLIRAHGEPPETYQIALQNNIELIDASCPVVLKLQNRVKNAYDQTLKNEGQIVIYGKEGHAEVIGLSGQTNQEAIIVMKDEDLAKIDYSRPITLFSQTTKSTEGFYRLKDEINKRIHDQYPERLPDFDANDSICRQVSNREPQLEIFAKAHDVILFVSGKKSSNGKALYEVCKRNNPESYFIENEFEVQKEWFSEDCRVGICGATSTPMWLMERVRDYILKAAGELERSI